MEMGLAQAWSDKRNMTSAPLLALELAWAL